jgi:L-arabinonolactonase
MRVAIDVVTETPDLLGEGPVYDPATGALYRVDITGRALRRLDLSDGATRDWSLPLEPGSFALREHGDAVLALEDGLWSVDLDSGVTDRLADITAGDDRVALNDGRCDPAGQFWVGSYARNERDAIGGIFRVGVDCTVTRVVDGVVVGNGLDWSPDGGTFYYTDSAGTITACDVEDGLPVRPRLFARDDDCSPDGLVVDADGCVWSMKWDGWRIVRYRPDGRVDRVIEMPVQRPTAAAFGGPGLDTLFVTSATYGLDEPALAAQPLAGRVFALDAGARGRPTAPFRG